MIGALTRNTAPYQKWPSSSPLATGPIAPAAPVTLAHMAMALVRWSGGKTFTRIDSVDGMMNAAPTPMTARQAMSWAIDVENAAARHAERNSASPS